MNLALDLTSLVDGVREVRVARLPLTDETAILVCCAPDADWRAIRSAMLHVVMSHRTLRSGVIVYVSPCIAHDDCREHPEIGQDCVLHKRRARIQAGHALGGGIRWDDHGAAKPALPPTEGELRGFFGTETDE